MKIQHTRMLTSAAGAAAAMAMAMAMAMATTGTLLIGLTIMTATTDAFVVVPVVHPFPTLASASASRQTNRLERQRPIIVVGSPTSTCTVAATAGSSANVRLFMGMRPGTNGGSSSSSMSALERTAAHLEKLKLQQRHLKRRSSERPLDDAIEAYELLSSSSSNSNSNNIVPDPLGDERERLYQSYLLLPASELKLELKRRQLPSQRGRKPDLARRLAQDDLVATYGQAGGQFWDHGKNTEDNDYFGKDDDDDDDDDNDDFMPVDAASSDDGTTGDTGTAAATAARRRVASVGGVVGATRNSSFRGTSFAGLHPLSEAASAALGRAKFHTPSPIQAAVIPAIARAGTSCILHAATGSGKTLAYLLPVTERLWQEPPDSDSIAIILTPTRELAAQVAGIATVLAPPGTVRLVSRPSNLTGRLRQERGDVLRDADVGPDTTNIQPRIYVGSAKAIQQSLYGDGKMPAPPTSKPEAMWILQNTNYLVLDEVDRLLGVVGGNNNNGKKKKRDNSNQGGGGERGGAGKPIQHEKPAAVLTAAVTRLTLGKAITVAASATVGRPLKRELARCMGLTPQECPVTIRGNEDDGDFVDTVVDDYDDETPAASTVGKPKSKESAAVLTTSRAVTIPDTVQHYVVPVQDGTSPGKILTSAYSAIQSLGTNKRMLLVLTRNFGISTKNAIGALKHFQCQPEPISLLDALEADGTEAMMELHRKVTGASGVGGSSSSSSTLSSSPYFEDSAKAMAKNGYLLVTGEDSVRGLHLDGLDVVVVAGRPLGPDEYTHIAGRTGRAGKSGSVINIVSDRDADKLVSWEKMLGIQYERCDTADSIGQLVE